MHLGSQTHHGVLRTFSAETSRHCSTTTGIPAETLADCCQHTQSPLQPVSYLRALLDNLNILQVAWEPYRGFAGAVGVVLEHEQHLRGRHRQLPLHPDQCYYGRSERREPSLLRGYLPHVRPQYSSSYHVLACYFEVQGPPLHPKKRHPKKRHQGQSEQHEHSLLRRHLPYVRPASHF